MSERIPFDRITVGFDDTHPPGTAAWGVQRFGAGVVFAGPDDLLPVLMRAAPEPSSVGLFGFGAMMLAVLLLRQKILT